MSDRLDAVFSLIEKLKNDYISNDKKVFHIHPSITFELMKGTGGICIRATEPIKTQEILLIISESAQTTTKNIATKKRNNLTTLMNKVKKKLDDIIPKISEIQDYLFTFVIMYASSNPNNNNDTKCTFKEHMAYMPSHHELRNEMQIYWTKEQLNVLGGPKSWARRRIEMCQEEAKLAFNGAIYPVLKAQSSKIQAHFIMSSVSKCCRDFKSTEECLLESFLASYTIVQSRSHGLRGVIELEINPLIDLFNGVSDWSPDADERDRCNVALLFNPQFKESRSIYSQRDIDAGEELLILYGNKSLSQFLLKYGTIPPSLFHAKKPEHIGLICPPNMIPSDSRRIKALEKFSSPSDPLSSHYIGLDPVCYFENAEASEALSIARLEFLLFVVSIGSDEAIDIYLKTGDLPSSFFQDEMCRAVCQVIDYNVTLLQDSTTGSFLSSAITEAEYEHANRKDIPLWEKYALHSRICQKETLFMWRDYFCRRYNISPTIDVDAHHSNNNKVLQNDCCRICGRTYPIMKCTRCKAAIYCSRTHQVIDWKAGHKLTCRPREEEK